MKIVFAEYKNEVIKQAVTEVAAENPEFSAVPAESLEKACEICARGEADALVAGIDYTTREVVLACKDYIGVVGKTFSSCFVMKKEGAETLVLADAGVTKNPTTEQLADIVLQTYETARRVLDREPLVAMLSFSSFGSARDASIDKIQEAISIVRERRPEMKIDGEMQLDCAVNPRVAEKKANNSLVAGRANVLIVPDLNSGNILYKSLEQFGGYTAAGPILQGFKAPYSDLSRGSTVEDVRLVIETLERIAG